MIDAQHGWRKILRGTSNFHAIRRLCRQKKLTRYCARNTRVFSRCNRARFRNIVTVRRRLFIYSFATLARPFYFSPRRLLPAPCYPPILHFLRHIFFPISTVSARPWHIYTYVAYMMFRERLPLPEHEINSLVHGPHSPLSISFSLSFAPSLSSASFLLRVFFVHLLYICLQPYHPHAHAGHAAHAHESASRSLANDMACPAAINHLSTRYRRISSVVSMRVRGSPGVSSVKPGR